ncbi:sensor histidine kinase [Paenibacillus sp. 23TSA30-6]|uniref:sensor histidine kinase n=1 Tax=Paenibacillus sp. 23TSA30-6 TaxID=2546104 RepID=UPI00192DFCC9|nr:sensor histidine kinase [Paenibacillus sp. 23TSA30-6]
MRRELLKYVICLFLSCAGITMLSLIFTVVGVNTGFIMPANYNEQWIDRLAPQLKVASHVTEQMMSEGSSFAILDKKSKVELYGNMGERDLKWIKGMIQDKQTVYHGQKVFRIIDRGREYCVVQYYLRPQFQSAYLREHLPDYESTGIILLILCILAGVFTITTIFANKLQKNLNKLESVTQHIKNNNLDFEVELSHFQEINDVIISLSEMREALQESLKAQWELEKTKQEQIAALAHDIKIPVTIIKGNAELLSLSDPNSEHSTYIHYILNAGNKIEQYMNVLIQISKTENVLPEQMSRTSVKKLVEDLAKDTLGYSGKKANKLVLNDQELPDIEVYIYRELLQRALMNILSNAVDYTPEGGTIVFELSCIADSLSFTIIDSGKGFSREGLKKATQLFYMADKSRNSQGHYGIGLTFADKVVKLHHGVMMIENQNVAPHGGLVRIEIPVNKIEI